MRGLRARVAARLRRGLRIANVDDARVDEVYRQLAVFHDRIQHLESVVPPVGALEQLRADVERDLRTYVEDRFGDPEQLLPALRAQVALLRAERHDALLTQRVWATSAWIEYATVREDVLVSVVMPTRNRAPLLARAIESVRAQRHPTWELLVVDDGSTDDTPGVLAAYADDPRVRPLRGPGRGVDAACNVALDAARGDVVAYLDDDNLMHPGWLRAVVWAFDQRPDVDVVYGAQVREDALHVASDDAATLPWLTLAPFDRRRLEQSCFIDRNALAHRAGLPEARYDESLGASGDWELALRLTREKDALALPVLASLYRTTAHQRLTGSPRNVSAERAIRERLAEARPLRVLAYNAVFPLISETYVSEEIEALRRAGAEVAFASLHRRPAAMRTPHPSTMGLPPAIDSFQPDLLLLHWLHFAVERLPELEATGLPFAVRAHSFDFDTGRVRQLLDHPQCIGVWGFPHHAAQVPGLRALPTLLTRDIPLPDPTRRRDLVLSASAGVPKKNWPLLIEALSALPGVDRRVVVGVTTGLLHLPADVLQLVLRYDDPPLVQVNLTHDEVLALQQRAALLVYTLDDSEPFGNPMSVVEAMASGASVVMPDRPESRQVFGPNVRTYRTGADIVRHALDALAGGPEVVTERAANRTWAEEHFMDERLGKEFHRELADAYDAWRRTR